MPRLAALARDDRGAAPNEPTIQPTNSPPSDGHDRRITGAGIFTVVHLSTSLLAIGGGDHGDVFGTYLARRAASLSPIEAIARE